jgi:hypothetical protein
VLYHTQVFLKFASFSLLGDVRLSIKKGKKEEREREKEKELACGSKKKKIIPQSTKRQHNG